MYLNSVDVNGNILMCCRKMNEKTNCADNEYMDSLANRMKCLEEEIKQLRSTTNPQKEFLDTTVHDLRTPIQTILGHL